MPEQPDVYDRVSDLIKEIDVFREEDHRFINNLIEIYIRHNECDTVCLCEYCLAIRFMIKHNFHQSVDKKFQSTIEDFHTIDRQHL